MMFASRIPRGLAEEGKEKCETRSMRVRICFQPCGESHRSLSTPPVHGFPCFVCYWQQHGMYRKLTFLCTFVCLFVQNASHLNKESHRRTQKCFCVQIQHSLTCKYVSSSQLVLNMTDFLLNFATWHKTWFIIKVKADWFFEIHSK